MIVSAMLFIHATDDGARGESEMKASLAEVFTLTVVPLFELLRFIKPANAVMKRGCKGVFHFLIQQKESYMLAVSSIMQHICK